MNGIGERAGNTSIEEIVMSVKTRQGLFPVNVRTLAPSRPSAPLLSASAIIAEGFALRWLYVVGRWTT